MAQSSNCVFYLLVGVECESPIYLAFAKKYTDNLREEAMKGWAEKLAQGWMPSQPPHGYKTIIEHGKKIHVPDEETSFIIVRMFKLYLEPEQSAKTITEELTLCGITTKKGRSLAKSAVHRMLKNPFYMGTIHFNGKIYPGAHEPIISKELFDAVQEKLTMLSQTRTTGRSRHEFPFKGLIRCSACHGMITWQKQKERAYGSCQRRLDDCKKHKWLREDRTEEAIIGHLEKIEDPDSHLFDELKETLLARKNPFSDSDITAMTKLLRAQIRRLERVANNLYEDKLEGIIDDTIYRDKEAKFAERKNKIQSRIDELTEYKDKIDKITVCKSKHAIKRLYLQSNTAEKQLILSRLFSVIIHGKSGAIEVVLS